ncbi:MAG: hypothetical protein [Circoviridae sp.]|nr:MAG: hypothetical protein [Circoviridae sp.]
MASSWNGPESNMDTEVIYAVGAVTVSILGALRFSKCTRIKCGCIDIQRDASQTPPDGDREGAPPHSYSGPQKGPAEITFPQPAGRDP